MKKLSWAPPSDWVKITTIDAHTAGEPLRVILSGYPEFLGKTILEKRRYAKQELDFLRTALMWEPRGHADMYGCVITEPETEDGTIGVIFMHNEGYSTMCGHGVIGLAKVALDTGLLHLEGDLPVIKMDTPAGRVTATAHRKNGLVDQVSFINVPSFVYALDQTIDITGLGKIRYDVAFGGAFYAFIEVGDVKLNLTAQDFRHLIDMGIQLKRAIGEELNIEHPFQEDLSFLYGIIFIDKALNPENHSRNVCIFAEGEVDRCPTGTGLSARAALHYARNELKLGEVFTVESILGTTFSAEILGTTTFGPYHAVIPKVTGSANITGVNEWLIDPEDPLRDGFVLR